MEFLLQEDFELVLGWEFYLPLLIALVMIAFAVPVWAVLGVTSISMLYFSDVLPLGLVGEALFDGIDAFALIAVPLFILTGDVLVRTGLSNKLLNVAEAMVGGFRSGFGTATVIVCGFFACISGSDAAGAAGVGRMTIDRLVEQGYPKPYACALVAAGACTPATAMNPHHHGQVAVWGIGLGPDIQIQTVFAHQHRTRPPATLHAPRTKRVRGPYPLPGRRRLRRLPAKSSYRWRRERNTSEHGDVIVQFHAGDQAVGQLHRIVDREDGSRQGDQ